MPSSFAAGSLVFIPDDEEAYLAARVDGAFESGKAGNVTLLEGKRKIKLSGAESEGVLAMNEQSLEPLEDMVQLKQLDEASILYNLRLRFSKDQIYTNIGSILCSVNPFKVLNIYSPEVVDSYIRQGSRALGPHVYGVADDAYRQLVSFGRSQSCIVSGESGAGKTEATKLFLQYISERSSRGAVAGSKESSAAGAMSEQILEANPLLEAFGNAKTVRNNNSSRFGKLIEVHFDAQKGGIVGGSITSYLLEKSRLVQQAEGERNYHVFYQLCAAASQDAGLAQRLRLADADQYSYLNQSEGEASTVIAGVSDLGEWNNTVAAMEVMGISSAERADVERVLAAVLHLGNVRFGGTEEKSQVDNKEVLALAAEQLGSSAAALEKALTMRNRGNAKESVWANQGVAGAGESRDALAKAIYSSLFDWLIEDKINRCLSGGAQGVASPRTIGVLDIFGFESFERNSFEQLCINYCNEKLQGHFNEHIFKLEQEEYRREGVDVSQIDFVDNSAVLECLEAKTKGVFSLLDEENKLPRGTDAGFQAKVLACVDGKVLLKPDLKAKGQVFTVRHYAGEVVYDARGFLEKNKDLLLGDLAALGAQSSFKFLAQLFRAKGGGGDRKTIGTQFREQLAALMKTLNATEPHYVRCIKPNAQKMGNLFQAHMCLDQLRYAGLLEVCRIRKTGYPVRKDFAEFVQRYRALGGKAMLGKKSPGQPEVCAALEKAGLLAKGQWQAGKAKVFMRQEQFSDLEQAREKALGAQARQVQRVARGFLARRRFKGFKRFLQRLVKAVASRDAAQIEAALLDAGVLPHQGRHLKEVQAARKLLDELHEEQRVVAMLEDAIKINDLQAIQSALKAAEKLKGLQKADVVTRANKAVLTIEKVKAAAKELRAAVDKRDVKLLAAAIKAAEALDMHKGGSSNADYKDAQALLSKLEQEQQALGEMEKAVGKKDVEACKRLLPRMAELGLEDHKLTKQAQELAKAEAKRSEGAQAAAAQLTQDLDKAIAKRDLKQLEALSVKAIELGVKGAAVAEAARLRQELAGRSDVVAKLTAEMKALDIRSRSHDGLAAKDIEPLSKAIQKANDAGIASSEEEMSEAIAFEARMHRQVEVQAAALRALESNTEEALKAAAKKIQEVGLETGAAKRVLAEVRDQVRAANKGGPSEPLRDAKDEEKERDARERLRLAVSEAPQKRVREASDNAVFDVAKYMRVRSDADFTETVLPEQKNFFAEHKLRWQGKAVPKSLLEMSDELSRTAVQNHKAILQYCGDLSNSFPTAMAGYVLVRGQESPELADEIYMQLVKQATDNPRPLSGERVWNLFALCCRAFPPSPEFEPFLLNFLVNHRNAGALVGNQARLCITLLDYTIDAGPSPYLPDMDLVDAFNARPAILADVRRPEGLTLSVPVMPNQDVGAVLDAINAHAKVAKEDAPLYSIFCIDGKQRSQMDLRTRLTRFYKKWNPGKLPYVDYFCSTWSGNEEVLFATLSRKYGPEPGPDEDLDKKGGAGGKRASQRGLLRMPVTAAQTAAKILGLASDNADPAPSPESPWPLPWWAFLGDVYVRMIKQSRDPVLTHKRLILLDKEPFSDELFHQLREEVRDGDLPPRSDADMAQLIALDLMLQNDAKKPEGATKGRSFGDTVVGLLPSAALKKKSAADWEAAVKQALDQALPAGSKTKLMELYVETCRKAPLYGCALFYAQEQEQQRIVVICMDMNGLHIMDKARENMLQEFKYGSIAKFGASGSFFWLLCEENGKTGTKYYRSVTPWSCYSTVYSVTHLLAERMGNKRKSKRG